MILCIYVSNNRHINRTKNPELTEVGKRDDACELLNYRSKVLLKEWRAISSVYLYFLWPNICAACNSIVRCCSSFRVIACEIS